MVDISMELIRPTDYDSERTKLLKEVLRSTCTHPDVDKPTRSRTAPASTKMLSDGLGGYMKQKDTSDQGRPATGPPLGSAMAWRRQSSMDLGPDEQPDASWDEDLSSYLKGCGHRIGGLYAKLRATNIQTSFTLPGSRPSTPSGAARPNASHFEIVYREDLTTTAAKAREEEAAYNYISAHAEFGPIDDLDGNIEQSRNLDDLRKLFPVKHQYHPTIQHLTDQSAKNPDVFSKTVWDSFRFRNSDKFNDEVPTKIPLERSGRVVRVAPAPLCSHRSGHHPKSAWAPAAPGTPSAAVVLSRSKQTAAGGIIASGRSSNKQSPAKNSPSKPLFRKREPTAKRNRIWSSQSAP